MDESLVSGWAGSSRSPQRDPKMELAVATKAHPADEGVWERQALSGPWSQKGISQV